MEENPPGPARLAREALLIPLRTNDDVLTTY